jgi:hypothetical protein
MSAPENNTNAQRAAVPAESFIQMRVTRPRKAAYVRAANRQREKLTAWAQRHLDKASGYQEKGKA